MNAERGFGKGLGLGLAVGSVVLCLSSALVFVGAQKWISKHREGWNLVPVIVAAVDIAAGEVVTMEMISQRSVPEQFVTDEIIKPDSASSMVNDVTLIPMEAGDMLLWHGMRAQQALVLSRDVAAGVKLTGDDVVRGDKRIETMTVTMVQEDQLGAVLNSKTARALKRGDALHFSDLVAPEAR